MYCCINFELISASECVFVCCFAGGEDLKTEPVGGICWQNLLEEHALQSTDLDAI